VTFREKNQTFVLKPKIENVDFSHAPDDLWVANDNTLDERQRPESLVALFALFAVMSFCESVDGLNRIFCAK
jgi:hypothetical protein